MKQLLRFGADCCVNPHKSMDGTQSVGTDTEAKSQGGGAGLIKSPQTVREFLIKVFLLAFPL